LKIAFRIGIDLVMKTISKRQTLGTAMPMFKHALSRLGILSKVNLIFRLSVALSRICNSEEIVNVLYTIIHG